MLVAAYFLTGFGDTATLAAGVVTAADPHVRGSTLAVYALVGFVGGMAGPVAFGIVLNLAGGRADPSAWRCAFASLIGAAMLTAGALHLRRKA